MDKLWVKHFARDKGCYRLIQKTENDCQNTLLSFSVSKSSRNSEKLGKTLTRKTHGVTEKLNDSR